MTDTAARYQAIQQTIAERLVEYDREFREKHEDHLDFGHCGSGIVLISFGRKRKLKQEALDHGLISESHTWESGGRKEYVVEIPRGDVPTQYAGYYQDRAKLAAIILRGLFQDYAGVEVTVHTWVD